MEENQKSKVIMINENDFEEKVINQSKNVLVIVDFWAKWCMPCLMLGPILEKAVNAAQNNVVLAKLDVDENQSISQLYQINSIPAVKFFKNGKVIDEFVGLLSAEQATEYIVRNSK